MAIAPVSVCLIVKNESGQLESCLKSVRPYVAEICVVDTGSTDNSDSIAKKYADKWERFTDCNNSDGLIEDFSMARQRSFDISTQPWTMWVDGDDEVMGAENLHSLISEYSEVTDKFGPVLVLFPYEYAHDAKGNVTCVHMRERLISSRSAFRWTGPVHEVLIPKENAHNFQSDRVKFVHRRTSSNKVFEPGRNLRILKAYYDKHGESDVRQLYYLGLEYGNVGDSGNAIKFHKRYIELSGWDDERFLACLKIADHYQAMGDYETSVEWALKSLTIKEGWAEAYFSLGKSHYFMAQRGGPHAYRNWEKSAHFFKLGLTLPRTQTILFVNPMEREYDVHRYYNLSLSSLGRIKEALESASLGLAAYSDDNNLQNNKRIYEVFLAKEQVQKSVQELINLKEIDVIAVETIRNALDGKVIPITPSSLPKELLNSLINSSPSASSEAVVPIPVPSLPNTEAHLSGPSTPVPATVTPSPVQPIANVSGKKLRDVVIFVGPAVERWNPESAVRSGIGGSETAVIEVGKRLVANGYSVRVYGDCDGMEGVFDGVQYIHYAKYRNIECDVLIASRQPKAFDAELNVKQKVGFCWVHDIHCGNLLNHGLAIRIDRFLTLSDWHRQFFLQTYRFVHPSQVLKTRNGINLDRFQRDFPRNPHRAVYSSSPDRGMQVAIQVWPIIRQRVPDAELHLYYGFQTWEPLADDNQKKLIAHLKRMIDNYKNSGVVYHGRVDQTQLAEEFLKSGVWAYPTWFSETSCITAMEAQAAGLRIVTSSIAALNETVGPRGKLTPGEWTSWTYQSAFIDSVVEAMLKPGDDDRKELQAYARDNFSWDSLVRDWMDMFEQVYEEVQLNVLPPYKGIL